MRLQGKVAIITGAAQGIGLSYAQRFVREGAIVALADINVGGVERAAAELHGEGFVATAHPVDVSDMSSTDALATDVLSQHGRIDILLNNAAIYQGIDNLNTTPEYLEKIASVNLWGVWKMSHSVVPAMIAQHSGKIINQSSAAAWFYGDSSWPTTTALPNFSYAISKWGVNGMTKFMAGTLGPHNITVNCVAPGVTLTDATKGVMTDDMIAAVSAMVPLRRSLQPEDITGAAVFFASPDADLITGQILCVDGGWNMPG